MSNELENNREFFKLIFGCNNQKIDFLVKEFEKWEGDLNYIIKILNYKKLELTINNILEYLYTIAFENALEVFSTIYDERDFTPNFFINATKSKFLVKIDREYSLEFNSKAEFFDYLDDNDNFCRYY